MELEQALLSRRSVRDFLPEPVSLDTMMQLLATASRAPSGGNLQPWHVDVVTGDALIRLKAAVRERLAEFPRGEPVEYHMYPPGLGEPYNTRRYRLGEDLYATLGVTRENKAGRWAQFNRNFEAFGAPMLLFFSLDRSMGPPQWADLGMYLQSLMLLIRARELDSCPQESWSLFPEFLRGFLGHPRERILWCGLAVGRANTQHPVNALRAQRAGLDEFVRTHTA